jgi:hypothetical protein
MKSATTGTTAAQKAALLGEIHRRSAAGGKLAASTHTPADNGWHYQTNKANLFPMHNGGYAKSSPYEDIATGFEIYFYGNPSDREAIRPKLNALDAFFASLA